MKKQKIREELKKIIKDLESREFKILFLIESGSRAWGWESKDSDYDIRGVFIQDYLRIGKIKKQINMEKGDLDVSLWDLRKFLRLILKSNPTVWEWLSSKLIYKDHPIRKELKKIFKKSFSEYSLKKHYISMAKQNFNKYIEGKKMVNLKKYVYILRSLACVLWIQKHQTPPPKHYKKVIGFLPKDIQKFFEKIVEDKRESESLEGERDREVDKYIQSFFGKEKDFKKDISSFDEDALDKIFKKILNKKN